MGPAPANPEEHLPLTEEMRMLVRIRDTLYEGSWEDFVSDLRARAAGRPHVYTIVPDSPEMTATIGNHLALIDKMQAWEASHLKVLRADNSSAGDS